MRFVLSGCGKGRILEMTVEILKNMAEEVSRFKPPYVKYESRKTRAIANGGTMQSCKAAAI